MHKPDQPLTRLGSKNVVIACGCGRGHIALTEPSPPVALAKEEISFLYSASYEFAKLSTARKGYREDKNPRLLRK